MSKRVVTLLLAGIITVGAGGAGAQEWQPTFVDGVLQPLPDGFPDRPITLVNVDDAGTASGLYVRTVQQALQGISPVEIRISDEPRAAGGTVHALADITANREGGDEGYFLVQGTTIGVSTDFLSEPVTEETGWELDDVNFLISTSVSPWVVLQRPDAPWGDGWDSLVEYGKANPGQIKYISPGVGGGLDIFMTWLLDQAGIEVNKVPAADREAALSAVGGGAGDITSNNATSAAAAGDRVDIVLVSTPDVPEVFAGEGVASASDFQQSGIEEIVWGTYDGFVVGSVVPEDRVAWLHALIAAGTETEAYQQRAQTTPGLVIRVVSSEENNATAQKVYSAAEPIVRAAGLHWEDNR